MSEAVRLSPHFASTELGAERVMIRAMRAMRAARRVAERLGFRLRGTPRGMIRSARTATIRDTLVFAMIPEDFARMRAIAWEDHSPWRHSPSPRCGARRGVCRSRRHGGWRAGGRRRADRNQLHADARATRATARPPRSRRLQRPQYLPAPDRRDAAIASPTRHSSPPTTPSARMLSRSTKATMDLARRLGADAIVVHAGELVVAPG